MSRRHFVIPLSALSLALAGLSSPATASPSPGAALLRMAPAATATAAPGTSGRTQVRILGGDIVSVVRTASGAIAPQVSSVTGSPVTVISTPTTTYAFPHALRAVIGGRLDTSLFDVRALAAAGRNGLPVTVTYASTSAPTAVPGVEILSRSGLAATGRVTPSSSAALGVALRTASASTMFSSVAKVTASAGGGVQPQFPMHTLTINAIDASGRPMAEGMVVVINLDVMDNFVAPAFVTRGVAKVSVPAGTYALVASAVDPRIPSRMAMVVRPDVTVAGATSTTVDARTATAQVRFSTPKPATLDGLAFSAILTDAAQLGVFDASTFGFGDVDLRVSPVPSPSVGSIGWSALAHLDSPVGVAPYSYDLERVGTGGIPDSLTFLTRSADLSVVKASYASPVPGIALPGRTFVGDNGGGGFGTSVQVPLQRTEYVAAPPGTVVADDYIASLDPATFSMTGYLSAQPWSPQPGTTRLGTWNKAPLTPRLVESAGLFGPPTCPACIVGDALSVMAHPFTDSSPTHIGFPDPPSDAPRTSTSWTIALDGAVAASGGDLLAAVVGGASTAKELSVGYTTDGRVGGAKTPSHTVTRWTIPLAAARSLPPSGWQCWTLTGPAGDPSSCRVLPLISLRYELPTDLSGTIPAGATRARLLVSHVDASHPISVSTPTMQVSFDGGSTWQLARVVAEGSGNFTVTWTTPALTTAPRPAMLKVTVTDAVGGRFSELVTSAFTVR